MGINGLLQQLKSISRPTHVSSYRGQKVAIDGYSWLHKGAYSCSRELCEGIWADGYIRYFVSRIDMLLGNGVIPVVVFDGCRLPMKADEEDSRRRNRREALERARAHAASGNLAAATECYQRAVDIAPWMAKVVMEALRERGITCLVAPYEADAQMSYLALRGEVYAVLTEDSDMLAYGCPRVLYKLDRSGTGEEVVLSDLPLVRELNMAGFDHDMLLQMCILAGCDFLPNLSGVGIKKAHALIRKHRDFVKVVRNLRFNGASLPPGYEVRFQRTIWLFRHQRVFCSNARTLTHIRPLPPGGLGAADVLVLAALPPEGPEREELTFLGPPMEQEVAAGIAMGDLDPSTLQSFDLPAIYRGCAHPPRHLRPLLQPSPLPPPPLSASATQQQQQQHGSQGAGGSQRPFSCRPASGASGSQDHYYPPNNHQHNRHNRQHMSQQQGSRYSHSHSRPPVAGKPHPPVPPNGRIDRYFFMPNPAASQPFRHHHSLQLRATELERGQSLGPGHGGEGVASGSGGPAVVTLSGLQVEVAAAAAAAAAYGLENGSALEGRVEPAGASEAGEPVDHDTARVEDAQDCCSPPSAKRRRLARCPAAAPAAGAGCGTGNSDSLFGRFRRVSSMQRGAHGRYDELGVGDAAGGAATAGAPAAWTRTCGGFRQTSISNCAAASVDGPGGGSASGALGLLSTGAVGAPEAGGGKEALLGPTGSAPGSSQCTGLSSQGLTRPWCSGAESDPLVLEGHTTSDTATRNGSQYGSQYDSQPTSGCEGAGWASAWRAGGGGGLMAGRSRAPARLAMEALFMETSGGSAPMSQSQPALRAGGGGTGGAAISCAVPCPGISAGTSALGCGGGSSIGAGRQVLGALATLQNWRHVAGTAVLGVSAAATATAATAAGASQQPTDGGGSMDPDFQTASERDPLGWGEQGDAADADALGLGRGLRVGVPPAAVPVASAPGAGGDGADTPRPPPQFSVYDLEEQDLFAAPDRAPALVLERLAGRWGCSGDACGAATGLGRGPPPWVAEDGPSRPSLADGDRLHVRGAPNRQCRSGDDDVDGDDEDGDGEAEVTSPLKLPPSLPPRPPHHVASGHIRRLFLAIDKPAGPSVAAAALPPPPLLPPLLHPSARRRLLAGCGNQQQHQKQPHPEGSAAGGGLNSRGVEARAPGQLQGHAASGLERQEVEVEWPGLGNAVIGSLGSAGFQQQDRLLDRHPLLGEEPFAAEEQAQAGGWIQGEGRGGREPDGDKLPGRRGSFGAADLTGMMGLSRNCGDAALHGHVGKAGRLSGFLRDAAADADTIASNGGGDPGSGNGDDCRGDGSADPNVAEFNRALERSEVRWRSCQRRRRPCNAVLVEAHCAPGLSVGKADHERVDAGVRRDVAVVDVEAAERAEAAEDGIQNDGGMAPFEGGGSVVRADGSGAAASGKTEDAAAAAAACANLDPGSAAAAWIPCHDPELADSPKRKDVHELHQQHPQYQQQQQQHYKEGETQDQEGQFTRKNRDRGQDIAELQGHGGGGGRSVDGAIDINAAVAATAGDEEDDDVHITSDMRVGGGGGGFSAGFHSLEHVAHFALVAKRALDTLECSLAAPSPAAGGHAPRHTQLQRERTPFVGDDDAAAAGRQPASAGAALAVRPLSDFAFVRSALKRRSSASRTGGLGTPAPVGPGRCRPSVFVQPTSAAAAADAHADDDGCTPPPLPRPCSTSAFVLSKKLHGSADLQSRQARDVRDGDGDDTGENDNGNGHWRMCPEGASGGSDGDSDEVVIVREALGTGAWQEGGGDGRFGLQSRNGGGIAGAGPDRRMRAEAMLRRPFQPPRTSSRAPKGAAAAAGRQGGDSTPRQALVVRRTKSFGVRDGARDVSQLPPPSLPLQQQRITDFGRFAFIGSK